MDQQDFLGSWIFVENLAFGCSSLFLFYFLFSLVQRGTRASTKIWFVTEQLIASCFPQILIESLLLFSFFFAFDNFAHGSDIVWSKEPFYFFSFFLFYFLLLFFNLWLVDFLLFFWRTFITPGKRSFFWKILLFSLPRVRLEISIPGQGYGQNVDVWLQVLQMARHDVCRDICLASGSGIRECPKSFPWHAYDDDD